MTVSICKTTWSYGDEMFRKWIFSVSWDIRLDTVEYNKSSAPPKNWHLAQAEKNTYASKPFDVLEIVMKLLR